MDLIITPCGRVRCIYDEAIDMHELGALTIRRASHVEPTPDGNWSADLSPIGGIVLLGPFANRSQALAAEAAWLADHWLMPGT